MATERIYTIPLRREWLKAVKYQRAKKAIRGIKEFLKRHMKVEMSEIKLGTYLNIEIWKHGIKNPPTKIRVNVIKDDKGLVRAELVGAPVKIKVEEPKKGAKAPAKPATVAKPEVKPAETKPAAETKLAEKPAEKKPEVKPEETKPAENKPEVKKEVKPAEVKPAEKKPEEKKPEPKPAEKPAENKPEPKPAGNPVAAQTKIIQ